MAMLLRSLRAGIARLHAMMTSSDAAQIAEFAISVPLLVVFAVSIYDFGNAFGIKYKLSGAVREGTRFAANEPGNDLSSASATGPSGSVSAIAAVVSQSLQSVKVN